MAKDMTPLGNGNLLIAHECIEGVDGVAVVHACKTPCHQRAVGYTGKLDKDHEHYISTGDELNLYLNIIDPPVPLFPDEIFKAFAEFMLEQEDECRPVAIHCNQGKSRSPSLALLWMAHGTGELPSGSYEEAREAFEALYPAYDPGKGIEKHLSEHWPRLRDVMEV